MSAQAPVKMKSEAGLLDIWNRLRKNHLALFGLVIVVLLVFFAITADFIAPYRYDQQNLMKAFESPSKEHFFGTDEEVCLTHRATSRRVFVSGAVAAAKRIIGREPGFYTFDELMFGE